MEPSNRGMMAEAQLLEFQNRFRKIIVNSCAVCIAFYIDTLNLQKQLCVLQLMSQKKFLKFFYQYLKGGSYDRRFRNIIKQRRIIKRVIFDLHEDIISIVIRTQRLRNS